jgi:hypothetical protein
MALKAMKNSVKPENGLQTDALARMLNRLADALRTGTWQGEDLTSREYRIFVTTLTDTVISARSIFLGGPVILSLLQTQV